MRKVSICVPKLIRASNSFRDSKVLSCSAAHGRKFYATKPEPKKLEWDHTISEAERLVGYPTSFLSLRWLLSDEIANVTLYLRKLVGSNHPSLQTAKNLLYNGKNSMQTWGLVVLLLSKAAGFSDTIPDDEQDKSCRVLHKQRALAEVTEMIRIAHLVHSSLVNLQSSSPDEKDHLNFGNKIGLLTGDYLLGHSSLELSKLRNQIITEIMSSAVRDFTESAFVGDRDSQNNAVPYKPSGIVSKTLSDLDDDHFETDFEKPMSFEKYVGIPDKEWEVRNMLSSGSLLAKSCHGAMTLAGQPESLQRYGFYFGKHFALAWQASLDCEPFFKRRLEENSTFSLVGAPVLFHLNFDPSSFLEIVRAKNSIEEVNFEKLHKMVRSGPALELTKDLQLKHTTKALRALEHFPPSEARTALENILLAMQGL